MRRSLCLFLLLSWVITGCVVGHPGRVKPWTPQELTGREEEGPASWYGKDFHGRPTASGEIFDMDQLTAAHPRAPLGSWAYVTHLSNGRTALVKINDRGPFVAGRILDLSRGAAQALGMENEGVARVRIRFLGLEAPADAPSSLKNAFTVQVGAFTDKEHAESFLQEVKEKFPEAYLSSSEIKGIAYHRVRIGSFPTRNDAARNASQISAAGYTCVLMPY